MGAFSKGIRPPVIGRELAKELEQYKGLWVAIESQHVVASGETLADALAESERNGVPRPLTYHVPSRVGPRIL